MVLGRPTFRRPSKVPTCAAPSRFVVLVRVMPVLACSSYSSDSADALSDKHAPHARYKLGARRVAGRRGVEKIGRGCWGTSYL